MPGPWSTCPRRSGGSTPGRLWSWGPENSCGTCPLAFGESDGAKRVKAALSWQKRDFFVEGAWRQKNFWLQAAQWTVFALTLLLLLGGPRERFIPRDVLLNMDRQYGCVQELVKELNGNLPSYAPVREGWLQVREENLVVMALHLDDGRWLKAVYFRYKGTWGCDGREWMDAAPDLAGYVPFYPEDQSLVP